MNHFAIPCVASFQDAITKSKRAAPNLGTQVLRPRSDRSQALSGKGNERGCSGGYIFGKNASDQQGLKLINVKIYVKISTVNSNFSPYSRTTPLEWRNSYGNSCSVRSLLVRLRDMNYSPMAQHPHFSRKSNGFSVEIFLTYEKYFSTVDSGDAHGPGLPSDRKLVHLACLHVARSSCSCYRVVRS